MYLLFISVNLSLFFFLMFYLWIMKKGIIDWLTRKLKKPNLHGNGRSLKWPLAGINGRALWEEVNSRDALNWKGTFSKVIFTIAIHCWTLVLTDIFCCSLLMVPITLNPHITRFTIQNSNISALTEGFRYIPILGIKTIKTRNIRGVIKKLVELGGAYHKRGQKPSKWGYQRSGWLCE